MPGKSTALSHSAASRTRALVALAALLASGLGGMGAARATDPPAAPPAAGSSSASASAAAASSAVATPRAAGEDRPIADPPGEPTPAGIRRAKEAYNEGTAFVQKGDLEAAFRAFRTSYEQDGGAEALANMAVVEKALGRSRAAAEHLDAAMTKLPAAQAGKIGELKQRLSEICQDITVLQLRITGAGTQVYVDERWLGASPVLRTVYVDPGGHVVLVKLANGRDIRRLVLAKKGATEVITVDDTDVQAAARLDAPMASAAAPAPAPVSEGSSIAPWIAGGIGLAFLGTGAVGLGVYLRAHGWRTKIDADVNRLGGFCGTPPTPGFVDDCHARDQEATNETIGTVLGLAGAVGAGGLALGGLLVWATSPPSSPAKSARVQVVPTLGGVVVQGQF